MQRSSIRSERSRSGSARASISPPTASATVEGRIVHSLHAYFLRRGDFSAPIVYQVERVRDGLSFTTRRVTAVQQGRTIAEACRATGVSEASYYRWRSNQTHREPHPRADKMREAIIDHLHLDLGPHPLCEA